MKRTQIIDALRNIRKQLVSFLSITVIAALGVTIFLGLDFSASAIERNASAFYNENDFRDIEAVSTLLFSKADIDAVRTVEGVRDAENVYTTNAKTAQSEIRTDVQVLSLTERINLPFVYEGRLPEAEDECAPERMLCEQMGWKIGDRISVTETADGIGSYLKTHTFVVCGIVLHPDHVCATVPTTPYIMVTQDAFDRAALADSCMKIEIQTEHEPNVNRYDQAYAATVASVMRQLEELAGTRTGLREQEVRSLAADKIAENREKLDDAERQLKDARAELDAGKETLADGERQYADGEAKLADARAELDDAKRQLEEGEQTLKDSRAQLDDAKAQLEAGAAKLDAAKSKLKDAKAQLVSGWNTIEDAKTEIRDTIREKIESAINRDSSEWIRWASREDANPNSASQTADAFRITEGYTFHFGGSLQEKIDSFLASAELPDAFLRVVFEETGCEGEYTPEAARAALAAELASVAGTYGEQYDRMADGCSQWDAGHAAYLDGRSQYLQGLAQYNDALALYNDGEAQYAEGLQKYEDAYARYLDGEAQYEQGVKDLAAAREELEEGRRKLADGEAQYADGLLQFEDGRKKLADAEKQIETLGPCNWILMNPNGNTSFVQLSGSASSLKRMELTFALLFVLIGALVIYATISKMVDEQRTLVGVTKALGFFNREILVKYLLFGVIATVLGALIGLVMALTWVQSVVLNGYNMFFSIDIRKHAITALPTLLVLAAGIALAVIAVWLACRRLVKQPAIRLMQQAVPSGGKQRAETGRNGLPLYSRLILRNIRTDMRRVLVTVVSIAGCCTLIVIGVTLRHAVNGAEKLQLSEITHHDLIVQYDTKTDAEKTIEQQVAAVGGESCSAFYSIVTYQIEDLDIMKLYCGDLDQLNRFYAMNDAWTQKPVELPDDGVLIAKRCSEIYHLKAGDTVAITMNGTETAEVRIAGVIDSYMDRMLFMSDGYFKTMFGKDAVHNVLFVQLNGADREAFCDALKDVAGYESYESADSIKELFRSATSVMNLVVLLFIFMAGIMAGVVLMNLTNIYILQKKRELTVMRINGFTVRETIGYILRETYVTTTVGIVLGIVLGSGIGYLIVRALELAAVQFDRSVSPIAWLIGAVITVIFAVAVNAVALRKVRHLKLTDI